MFDNFIRTYDLNGQFVTSKRSIVPTLPQALPTYLGNKDPSDHSKTVLFMLGTY